jgi:hypothetical protein
MKPLRLALFLFVVFGVSLIAVGGAVLLLEPRWRGTQGHRGGRAAGKSDRSRAAGEPVYCPRAGAADLAAAASSFSRILVDSSYISRCSSIDIRDNSSCSGGGAGAGATYLCVGLPNA